MKRDILLVGGLVLSLFGLFVLWRINVQKTKQYQELTKQYEYIMKNPRVEYIQGPTKIVQGPTRIIEKIVIQRSSETITTERTIETSTSTIETEGTSYISTPIFPKETPRKRFSISVGYFYNDGMLLCFSKEQTKFNVGIGIVYSWRTNETYPLILVQYKF